MGEKKQKEMTNKEIALAFLTEVQAGNIEKAYDKYVHSSFVHHMPYFKGDRQSLMEAMIDADKQYPEKVYEPLRSIAENELVTVHGRIVLDSKEYSVLHLFRIENGKIVESWEASQESIENPSNKYGLF